jgi:Ca2+-binding RTX toxin-like protein
LRGGAGTDTLVGGAGNDRFDWDVLADAGLGSSRDRVLDFATGDKLDLAGIDARSATSTNDAFAFIGTADFSGVAGQLRYSLVQGEGSSFLMVQGDVNGDGVADFEIAVFGQLSSLKSTDFVL